MRFHGISTSKLNRTLVRLRDIDEELLSLKKRLEKAEVSVEPL